jgi:Phage integrase family
MDPFPVSTPSDLAGDADTVLELVRDIAAVHKDDGLVYDAGNVTAAVEEAGPGGHSGATLSSSATDLTPDIGSSDKPQPAPATLPAPTAPRKSTGRGTDPTDEPFRSRLQPAMQPGRRGSPRKALPPPLIQLPRARLHDLRHLHATTLLMAGEAVHVVANRLGHSDPAITLRVYAHVINESSLGPAEALAKAVAGLVDDHDPDPDE